MKKNLKILKKIEDIRKKNNSNWMDILRIALKYAPKQTLKTMKRIHQKDNQISKLFKNIKV